MGTRRAILRAAGTVGSWTLVSRVLGLVRDVLSTALFGAGEAWDAFVVAWTIPNTFRRFFGEGALASAFIPALARVREESGDEEAERLVNSVFSALLVLLAGICALGLAALLLFPVSALEGAANTGKLDLILRLLRVVLPYLVLICLTAFLGSVLQSVRHFAAPSMAPALLNVCWIAALFLLCPALGTDPSKQIFGVAVAVLVGGVLQLAICIPPLRRRGIRIRPTLRFGHPALRELLVRMVPIVVGLAPTQINILADRFIAEACVPGDGANSYLYYGTRIMLFPMALIGIAMATAVFPTLSALAARGDRKTLRRTVGEALETSNFVAIPAAVGLAALAFPIVRFLFEHGEFIRGDTLSTTLVIRGYALGIPLISAQQILTRSFYAQGDTKTPVRVALVSMGANLALNLILVWPLREAGLALATSLAALVNLILLGLAFRARLGGEGEAGRERGPGLLLPVGRIAALSAAMGGICYMMYRVLDPAGAATGSLVREGIAALVPVLAGAGIFLGGAAALRCPELREILAVFRGKEGS